MSSRFASSFLYLWIGVVIVKAILEDRSKRTIKRKSVRCVRFSTELFHEQALDVFKETKDSPQFCILLAEAEEADAIFNNTDKKEFTIELEGVALVFLRNPLQDQAGCSREVERNL